MYEKLKLKNNLVQTRIIEKEKMVGNHPLPDIAFFHHRLTMHLVPSRQKLVQVVCKALREVSQQVFDYDARLVTLFYEEGAPSRFIRQKLMFNIAPVDKFRRENTSLDLADSMQLTQYPFLYTYIYGYTASCPSLTTLL